jgi:hypothetical protein
VAGTRIPRTVVALIFAVASWWRLQALAGDTAPHPMPAPVKAKAEAKKPDAPTKKISGRAFDSHGTPVAGAMLWLTRNDDRDRYLPIPEVLAEAQSGADGRFDLALVESELKRQAEDADAELEIWIFKPGLAVGHTSFVGRPPHVSINLVLQNESPIRLMLKNPNGTPCSSATVTPRIASAAYARSIPQALGERLRVQSGADGRVSVGGFSGLLKGVTIEKPELGSQTLVLPDDLPSPYTAVLNQTITFEGRLVVPKGAKLDLAAMKITFELSSKLGGTWLQRFSAAPDKDGRFKIEKVLEHGKGLFRGARPLLGATVDSFPYAFVADRSPATKGPAGSLNLEIHLIKGICCSARVLDAQTKKPIPGVGVLFAPKRLIDAPHDADTEAAGTQNQLPDTARTDEQGRARVRLAPGEAYYIECEIPEGYLRPTASHYAEVRLPADGEQFEVKPFELVRSCAITGSLVEASGQPLAAVLIRGNWREETDPGKGPAAESPHWATTDPAGHFQFAGIGAGTKVTLLPVRAGAPLTGPVTTVAGDGNICQLRANENFVALAGRVLGEDRKPLSGARVVVDVADSPDPSRKFQVTLDTNGSFRTPAQYPPRLKYRLSVCSMLETVASTAWICPANSGTQFPDLVVDPAKVNLHGRLTGKEVVARVNGQPILAAELLERAFAEPLSYGHSLLSATEALAEGRMTEAEFRSLQDTAIKKYLSDFVKSRLLTQTYLVKLDAGEKKTIEEAVVKEFDRYVEKLKIDFKASTLDEVDRGLGKLGSSLASLRAEFRYRLIADEYLRTNTPDDDLVWRQARAYYQAERGAYATRAEVNWQLLEINFDKGRTATVGTDTKQAAAGTDTLTDWADPKQSPNDSVVRGTDFDATDTSLFPATKPKAESKPKTEAASNAESLPRQDQETERKASELIQSAAALGEHIGPQKARSLMGAALAQLHQGTPFEMVAKRFSDGPEARHGGWQTPTRADSIADEKTAAALRQLPEGGTSPVIETDHSLRVVRVVSRVAAGLKPFEEVEQSIRGLIRQELQRKALEEIFSGASIEMAFAPDAPMLLRTPPLPDSEPRP